MTSPSIHQDPWLVAVLRGKLGLVRVLLGSLSIAAIVALGLGSCLDLELANPRWRAFENPDGSISEFLPDAEIEPGSGGSSTRGESSAKVPPHVPMSIKPTETQNDGLDAAMGPDLAVIPPTPDSGPDEQSSADYGYQACVCIGPNGFVDSVLTHDNWEPADCTNFCVDIGAAFSRLVCLTPELWTTGADERVPTVPSEPTPNSCEW